MPYPKTLKLEISDPAKDDLQDILQYTFSRYGERQVDVYLQALYEGMELLTDNPEIGHRRNDMPPDYQALNVGKHLLVFTVKDDRIVIARILHQSRDMKRLF
ncbi:MAG: type II toxin-antitoxin system RelE/ParE family toxin [bacterium]|nr:type II toxin-antitoxin system RelE/ParE family toxin [bacterium]